MRCILHLLPLLTLGCIGEDTESGTNACRAEGTGEADLDAELVTDEGRIATRIVSPAKGDPASVPVVLQLFGQWTTTTRPEEGNIPVPGAIVVRVALTGEGWGDGLDDVRGPNARAAVAAALQYAGGTLADSEGCFLDDRFPAANTAVVVLLGESNGGNLAAATLADPALDFPPPTAVVFWETPAGAQFVDLDFGSTDEVYSSGSCTLDPENGVTCGYQPGLVLATDGDTVCFDLDRDGLCTSPDVRPRAHPDPVTGKRASSPPFADAIEAAGIDAPWDTRPESLAFWADRDAARLAPAMLARFPDLRFLLLASETDHALISLQDHPHVFGLGEALQRAGAAWVRLNPGSSYTGLASENAVNMPLFLSDSTPWLLSEEEEAPLSSLYAAAVDEVRDRAERDAWEGE